MTSTCGASISVNCSYIKNPGFPSAFTSTSGCSYTINKCDSCKNLKTYIVYTVLSISVCPRPHGLETRVIIKISTQEPLTTFHGIKQIIFFFSKKKIQNGRLKKTSFCQTVNSQYFFAKLSGMGPWVIKID